MWRDRETPSEPTAGAKHPDSPDREGNAPASPRLSSPALPLPGQHPSPRTGVPQVTLCLSLGHLQSHTRLLPWMAPSPQPSFMGQEEWR